MTSMMMMAWIKSIAQSSLFCSRYSYGPPCCYHRAGLLFVVLVFVVVPVSFASGSRAGTRHGEDRDISGILKGAGHFGDHMIDLFNTVSGTGIYENDDRVEFVASGSGNIHALLYTTGQKMEKLMGRKERAVKALKRSAERAIKAYGPYTTDINFESMGDFNAKKVVTIDDVDPLSNQTEDVIRASVNFMPTDRVEYNFRSGTESPKLNLDHSSVHVPTNIDDESSKILNGFKWTNKMNDQFVTNRRHDSQLTWQYFCSSDGFFRIHPGMQWPRNAENVDSFDCRMRQWYTQAATSPKNIIILLDTSDSMKGLHLSIAKSTVFTILDTLSDQDYFNVIQFSDDLQYVVDCFNGTLMPATVDNISRMKGAIEDLEARQIADFGKAFVKAFELFQREHGTNHKKRICNRAIMLVTDGPPGSYDYIFKNYNWPDKEIRVFPFLIGKDVQDNRHARWMACANKGKLAHISTKADVQENVQKYIKVLSRPLAIHREEDIIAWSPAYLDYVTFQDDIKARSIHHTQLELDYERMFKYKGLGFVMSASMPVFDTRSPDKVGSTEDDPSRNLLGVVGADLRVNELLKLLPTYQLGVNAYAFAITNLGNILFHPDYKPFYVEQKSGKLVLVPRPKYNSVELSEVERPAAPETMGGSSDHLLRNYLLKQKSNTGEHTLRVVTHIENMKYVENRDNVYKFVEISEAFRLVFALPKSYGFTGYIKATKNWEEIKDMYEHDQTRFAGDNVEISKWIYCKTREKRYQRLANNANFYIYYDPDSLKTYCGEAHAKHLLTDVVITAEYANVWKGFSPNKYRPKIKTDYFKQYGHNCERLKGAQRITCLFETHSVKHGLEIMWIGTRSGVTRSMEINQFRTPMRIKEWVEQSTQTIKSAYYQRAVSLWDQGYNYVFTGPAYTTQKEFEYNHSYVVMTSVETVSRSSFERLPAAVLAVEMKYSAFYETFVDFTFKCQEDFCSYTCNDTEHFGCYIIDNNGFVLASNNPDRNGTSLFLGEHDGYLMRSMVDNKIFEEIQITDSQSTCPARTKTVSHQDNNASNFLLNPLQILGKALVWLMTEIILFMSQLTMMTWDGIIRVMSTETQTAEEDAKECGHWIPETYARYLYCTYVNDSDNDNDNWKDERQGASFIPRERPCELKVTRYNLDLQAFKTIKLGNSLPSCIQQCRDHLPSYQIKRLDTSNLFFVVSDVNCKCEEPLPPQTTTSDYDRNYVEEGEDEDAANVFQDRYTFSMNPVEKTYPENERCQRLRNLSDDLKTVEKTWLPSKSCLDSSSEEDIPCNS